MRSRKVLLLFVIGVSTLITIAIALPAAVEYAAKKIIQENISANVEWKSIEPIGLTGLRIIEPKLSRNRSEILSAKKIELHFLFVSLRPVLYRINAFEPHFDADLNIIKNLFKKSGSSKKIHFELEIVNGNGKFEEITFNSIMSVISIDIDGNKIRTELKKFSSATFAGNVFANGQISSSNNMIDSADLNLSLNNLPMKIIYKDGWRITADKVDTEILNQLLIKNSGFFNLRFKEELEKGGVEKLEHVSAFPSESGIEVNLQGLRWKGIPGEILESEVRFEPGRIIFDSISAFIEVDNDSAILKAEKGKIEDGRILISKVSGIANNFGIDGNDIVIDNGNIEARIDRFYAEIKRAKVEGSGRIFGIAADPDFEGRFRAVGLRISDFGANVEFAGTVRKILSERAANLDLVSGKLSWKNLIFSAGPARLRLEDNRISILDRLVLSSSGLKAVFQGSVGLNSSFQEILQTLAFEINASRISLKDFGLADIFMDSFAVFNSPPRKIKMFADGISSPLFNAGHASLIDSGFISNRSGGIELFAGDIKAKGFYVKAGRVVLSTETSVSTLELDGRIGESGANFSAQICETGSLINFNGTELRGNIKLNLRKTVLEFGGIQRNGNSEIEIKGAITENGIVANGQAKGDMEDIFIILNMKDEIESLKGNYSLTFEVGEKTGTDFEIHDCSIKMKNGLTLDSIEGKASYIGRGTGFNMADTGIFEIVKLSGKTQGGNFEAIGNITFSNSLSNQSSTRIDIKWRSNDLDLTALNNLNLNSLMKDINGKADAELILTGDISNPVLNGYVILKNLSKNVRGIGKMENISGRIEFSESEIKVIGLNGKIGEGSIIAEGRVVMRDTALYGSIRGKIANASIHSIHGLDGIADGDFEIAFGGPRPILNAKLSTRAMRFIYEEFTIVETRNDPFMTPTVDLNISAAVPELKLTAADLNMKLSCNEFLIKGNDIEPKMEGVLEGNSGRLITRQATFRIRSIRIIFPHEGEAAIQALAVARVGRIKVFADVSGPIANRKISLTSEPPKSEEELVRLLAFGREDSSGDAASAWQGNVAKNIVLPLSGGVGGGVGIESVRFEKSESDTGSELFGRVTVGAYLSDRMYLGYSQPTDVTGERSIELEYEIKPQLYLKFETGDRGTTGAGFEWRREY